MGNNDEKTDEIEPTCIRGQDHQLAFVMGHEALKSKGSGNKGRI